MAFIGLANQSDSIEMTAFPEIYRQHQAVLEPGQCVAVKGRLNIRNDEPTILIENIKSLTPKTGALVAEEPPTAVASQ